MRPFPLTAVLALAVVLAGSPSGAVSLRAQADGATASAGRELSVERPVLQHSFPLAGKPLVIVVDGLVPHAGVALQLFDPAQAPPSVVAALMTGGGNAQFRNGLLQEPDKLTTIWEADGFGRVVLSIPLTDADDAHRPVTLLAALLAGSVPVPSEPLHLQVLPPTLLLPTLDGLLRINLLDGSPQLPAIPSELGLRGAALSADGVLGYLLRDGGVLEVRATHQWEAEPLSRRWLHPDTDTLAGGPQAGGAFALARPAGQPFTPAAQLQFLADSAEEREPLLLEPMGQFVAGRRVAITPDGLSAFLAEDDLIVREIDLLSGSARTLLAVGRAGDAAITDLLIDGRRLIVATRGAWGRRGSLSSFDLDRGTLAVHSLAVDPLRLVALAPAFGADEHAGTQVLVVPAAGGVLQVLRDGLPAEIHFAPDGRWQDAVAVDGGALLLRETVSGAQVLDHLDALNGHLSLRARAGAAALPPVNRLVGGGAGAVVLLGDPSGAVHVLRPEDDAPVALPGVTARPDEAFAVLP